MTPAPPSALLVDLYQLTSLVPHHVAGLTDARVVMTFFSRGVPKSVATGEPARGYVLFAGLQRCLDHLERATVDGGDVDRLLAHETLGPALAAHPDLVEKLRAWKFSGSITAPPEGTPLFMGRAVRRDGSVLEVDGVRATAYCPYLVVETDLLSAKLVETPLLSTINHMSMVATKAAHLVDIARSQGDRAVVEFGSRRTHPQAAVDAALAAYIGGAAATSNVEAHLRHGIPMTGTMDHFAVQAWERPGVPRGETELAYFRAFHRMYPGKDVLLVDTYDMFSPSTGIANAVKAGGDEGPNGIRIDSNVTAETVWRARRLLDGLGAIDTRIVVSGGIDAPSMKELAEAPVDAYGIGENLVTSADAPVGVGAVAKLTIGPEGNPTTKRSPGSGKSHLPGVLQCFRSAGGDDVVGLASEDLDGTPLLRPVWTRDGGRLPAPPWRDVRAYARQCLDALPAEKKQPRDIAVTVSDALADLFVSLVEAP